MELRNILRKILNEPEMHAKWLNTLSMMENSGARKIKKCEDPVFVSETILKHASEEARHAYYLKKQLVKVVEGSCPTYESNYLIAPEASRFYLDKLDIEVCRFLKREFDFKGAELRFAAYLLVTFAIEVRADELYPIYKDVLEEFGSAVKVNTIIAEEEGHLAEMKKQISILFEHAESVSDKVIEIESNLYQKWVEAMVLETMQLTG